MTKESGRRVMQKHAQQYQALPQAAREGYEARATHEADRVEQEHRRPLKRRGPPCRCKCSEPPSWKVGPVLCSC